VEQRREEVGTFSFVRAWSPFQQYYLFEKLQKEQRQTKPFRAHIEIMTTLSVLSTVAAVPMVPPLSY